MVAAAAVIRPALKEEAGTLLPLLLLLVPGLLLRRRL